MPPQTTSVLTCPRPFVLADPNGQAKAEGELKPKAAPQPPFNSIGNRSITLQLSGKCIGRGIGGMRLLGREQHPQWAHQRVQEGQPLLVPANVNLMSI